MNKRLVSIIFLSIFVLLPSGIFAQSPDKILKKALKAMGGEKVLRNINSQQIRGKITRLSDGASGNYSMQTQTPHYFTRNYDLNGFEFASGFNGKSGWQRDSRDGLRTLTGNAGRDFQTEVAYRNLRWLDYKKEKTKISAGEPANINGKNAASVNFTTVKAVKYKVYFDSETGLPVREEIPAGDLMQVYDYADFRAVDGVQEAFTVNFTSGDEKFVIKLDEVQHNQQIAKTVFDFPKVSNEPLPDIKTLLDEIRANADKIDEILENYSFTQTSTSREIDKAGNLLTKDSETTSVSFYKSYEIRRLIAKNGNPLSEKEQAEQDKKIEKRIAEIENRVAEKQKKQQQQMRDTNSSSTGTPEDGGQRITIADALRGSLLINPRRERFRGRDVIVFDYEPNPAFKPSNRMEQVFALCNGVVWVDANDKQVARLEANLVKNAGNFIAKLKRGASFSLEQERINNEIWLPSVADINLSIKILFAGISINQLVKYGDYTKFSTEVKEGKVNNPPKP